jgi:amino acid permease
MRIFPYFWHKSYDLVSPKEKFILFIVPLICISFLDEIVADIYPEELGYLTICYLIFLTISRLFYLKKRLNK